jgi:hypothetical protein
MWCCAIYPVPVTCQECERLIGDEEKASRPSHFALGIDELVRSLRESKYLKYREIARSIEYLEGVLGIVVVVHFAYGTCPIPFVH